ncbi:flagellar assembly protein FliW [Cytobacillus horneckiae]|uniref:Flagellar assembly factor FliW n=1 Tax=Cytobacillus horneckiae TaxID=549687 RepID=A0A2N0ZBL8_9BACI|nr:flagellar assembly protein FliW [Cytobacillus horneckiae]MEC1154191.1 flagellar assembly protein FliW [Cytobacillus horneckiae]MED2936264.1 flagellar assembly protein FliW [Cytobacillus horneckiae]PKG26900.1 flagellar assembly protein FliW [Cytobacillus horneckiae]
MKIETKYQGTIEVNKEDVILFATGLPGFADDSQFVLLPFLDDLPYFILQSIQSRDLAFVVVDPYPFFQDYQYKLNDAAVQSLKIEHPEDVATFVILTLKEPFANTTANLQGPIVINVKEKLGKQLILNDSSYKTKHPLFISKEGASC